MEDAIEPSKNIPQAQCLYTVDFGWNQRLRLIPEMIKGRKPKPPFSAEQERESCCCERGGESRTQEQHNLREERKKEKGNLSRFGGSELVIFKPVIGVSNVVGLAPNLVSSFLT